MCDIEQIQSVKTVSIIDASIFWRTVFMVLMVFIGTVPASEDTADFFLGAYHLTPEQEAQFAIDSTTTNWGASLEWTARPP